MRKWIDTFKSLIINQMKYKKPARAGFFDACKEHPEPLAGLCASVIQSA